MTYGFDPCVNSFPLTAVYITIELMLVENRPVTAFILHGLSKVTEYLEGKKQSALGYLVCYFRNLGPQLP
jgi:hypothetical protein